MFDFQLSFSDDGESGGGGDDDDCNNLFYINHKHLPHVHYMRISTTQWWVLLL